MAHALNAGLSTDALSVNAKDTRILEIGWKSYFDAKLIDTQELELISEYDKKDANTKADMINSRGVEYAKLFLSLLRLNKDETIRYLLVSIEDILAMNQKNAKYFFLTKEPGFPFAPLLKCLDRKDDVICFRASKISAALLNSPSSHIAAEEVEGFLRWISATLKKGGLVTQSSFPIVQKFLMNQEMRKPFFAREDVIKNLFTVLKNQQSTFQLHYDVIFCFWLLSFDADIASKLHDYNIIPYLLEIIKNTVKEKVIRVSLSTLRNLLEKAPQKTIYILIGNKVQNLCKSLSIRKYTDEDIVTDIQFLSEELGKFSNELSSFDEYVTELKSGKLQWSPVHKSVLFWKNHAHQLNENDHELLRILVRILNSDDPTSVAVACHDIGEYVRQNPRDKIFVEELGGKTKIMSLMSDANPAVRYEALLAVQKMMVQNWEYLGKGSNASTPGSSKNAISV